MEKTQHVHLTLCLIRWTPGSICRDNDHPVELTVSFDPIGRNKGSLEFNLRGSGFVGLCQQQWEIVHLSDQTATNQPWFCSWKWACQWCSLSFRVINHCHCPRSCIQFFPYLNQIHRKHRSQTWCYTQESLRDSFSTASTQMAYLKNGQLPVRESCWVCENDMGVVGVFLAVLQQDGDVQQLINSNSNLRWTFNWGKQKRKRREFDGKV